MQINVTRLLFGLFLVTCGFSVNATSIEPIEFNLFDEENPHNNKIYELLNNLITSSHIVVHVDPQLKHYPKFWNLILILEHLEWINKVVYAGLTAKDSDQKSQLHPIDFISNKLSDLDIELLRDFRYLDIPLYGWKQNRLSGTERESAFQYQYPDSYTLGKRYEYITQIIGNTGAEELMHLFSMVHTISSISKLESQVNHDESAAFFSSEPGTLLIMPFAYHASKLLGVPAHLKHQNSDHKVISILISKPNLKPFYDPGKHFDYWLVPISTLEI